MAVFRGGKQGIGTGEREGRVDIGLSVGIVKRMRAKSSPKSVPLEL